MSLKEVVWRGLAIGSPCYERRRASFVLRMRISCFFLAGLKTCFLLKMLLWSKGSSWRKCERTALLLVLTILSLEVLIDGRLARLDPLFARWREMLLLELPTILGKNSESLGLILLSFMKASL
eukprot:CAMPEP_0170507696 /NCGR_PEP_ID=MMETSP0208-20121228/59774_1 /TAXON_ID=197538 /ORGANISM="Strombidium inclinatum, Strain S3" /LENGTH=122 /DNA_ID=CAMNT_0010790067 /DNA_START=472 /DNA_END=840 /DNA_ORIENTATION=-